MNRLVKQSENGILYSPNGYQCLEKLHRLEEIEEELGIDLITLFRALKNGIFKKGRNDLKGYILFDNCPVLSVVHKTISCELTENYGKTWALTRERLK